MAIKGTTKIQLFDAETGELTDEVIDENMVTNAVPNIINPALQMFLGDNVPLYSFLRNCSPIGKVLFGGILIFSEPLEEKADNIIPSVKDRNNIVGYAGQFSSVTGNTMKGSYNETESTELENGFTHVWDFSTEQANGEIAAVALTSAMGGDCGWDATANNAGRCNFLIPISSIDFTQENKKAGDLDLFKGYASIFNNVRYYPSDTYHSDYIITNGKYVMLMCTKNKSGVISVEYTVKKLTNDITLNQSIRNNEFSDNRGAIVSKGEWSSSVLTTPYSADLTRVQLRANVAKYCFRDMDYIYGAGVNSTLTFVDFVLNKDGTVTIKSPTNVTINNSDVTKVINDEVKPITAQFLITEAGYAYFDDAYAYLQTRIWNTNGIDTHFVRVSMSNPTDIKLFVKPNNSHVTCWIGSFQGDLILQVDKKFYRTSDFTKYYMLDGIIADPDTSYGNVIEEHSFTPMKLPYVGVDARPIKNLFYQGGIFLRPCLIAPYLATINNLAKPVAKTSSKTMKITYTIQNV